MMKLKVTFLQYNEVKAIILESYDWNSCINDIGCKGIMINEIIKIERVLEATPYNTEDTTNETTN
jgi:hypothetical protein